MKIIYLVTCVLLFGSCHCQIDENTALNGARNFLFPGGQIPSIDSGECVLASLARQQSQINFFDFFLQFSQSHRRYGSCPTEEELAQLNDEVPKQRIFGGTEAKAGQFPWMVFIYELETCNPVCGGTLINSKYVLTAAHCILTVDPSIYGLVIGEHRISSLNFDERHRTVRRISIHPEFDSATFNNDAALLQLQKPVTFSKFIRPACLLPRNAGTDRPQPPTLIGDPSCRAMGWGITETGGNATDVLMSVQLGITPDFVCTELTLQTSSERPAVFEGQSKFCAGGEVDRDTCMGDSGGPIICSIEGTYSIVGVTSYGPDPCGQVGQFGVYAKVAHPVINDWIRSEALRL